MSNEPRNVEPPGNGAYVSSGQIYAEVVALRVEMAGMPVRVGKLEDDVAALKIAQATSAGANQTWKSWLPVILTAIGLAAGAFYFSAR